MDATVATMNPKFHKQIEVLMSVEDVNCLADLARKAEPEVTVEIGSWAGGSARLLSCFSKRVFCIDHWMQDPTQNGLFVPGPFALLNPRDRFVEFCRNVEDGLHTEIFPCVGPSETWAAVWRIPIDFLYIDGDHSYEGCKADILGFGPHVRPGGMIVGHDYGPWEDPVNGELREFVGVAKAVDEIYPDRTVHPGTKIWSVTKV